MRKKVTDILEMIRARDGGERVPAARGRGRGRGRGAAAATVRGLDLAGVAPDELGRLIQSLPDEMHDAAKDLRFEEAARLRDEINELKRELASRRLESSAASRGSSGPAPGAVSR